MSRTHTLEISNLNVDFETWRGDVHALRAVNLAVPQNAVVGVVGESGCGKSTLINAILRLMPPNARVRSGRVAFQGDDVLEMNASRLQQMRGEKVSMVFQDPMTSMNPVISIGRQMSDALYRRDMTKAEKRARVVEMLNLVRIPDAEHRFDDFPHQFSGGMRQRICIAMALMMNPDLLIADEPTTALDVTLEAQIIHLFRELQSEFNCSVLFVSHNLGLIAELCDHVVVMYAGEVIERCSVHDLFREARHPYTRMLLDCDPARIEVSDQPLPTIDGSVPDLVDVPKGCVFAPRCPEALDICPRELPEDTVVSDEHVVRCHLCQVSP